MILVQELDRSTDAVRLVPNGETFDRMAGFIAHLGAVGAGLVKRPTINQPYGKKDEITHALHQTHEYEDGKPLFSMHAVDRARANLCAAIDRGIISPFIGADDIERLDAFKAGKDYEQLNHAGLVAIGGMFEVLHGPIEESFTSSDRELGLALQLGLTHEAMQYRVTANPSTAELDNPRNQIHASLGRLDENGEYQPVFTVFNDSYYAYAKIAPPSTKSPS
ncbi:MAG: hypothetical protein JWO35_277 [Candidatus Saccharibacteria bacterium]|nr:hypothetical protein [Candidatus Saccharibacteria bacterium]